MPLTMPSKRQKAVCCRPGCGKNPSRSIPTSLFTGARTKVCKACYTWMRRHFQVEPNGKHVRCAEAGILDRCAAMLEDFAKAGVFPSTAARRRPKLVLPESNRFSTYAAQHTKLSPSAHSGYSGAAPASRAHVTAETASSSHARHDDGLTAPDDQDMARGSPTPDEDAVRRRKEVSRRATSWDDVGVEFDELSDSDSDAVPPTPTANSNGRAKRADMPPKLTPTASASGLTCGTTAAPTPAPAADVDGAASDCDMDMDAQSEAGNWRVSAQGSLPRDGQCDDVDDVRDVDLDDSMSTHSLQAWRALVSDDMRSLDGDMELGDYDMWNPESDAASAAAPYRFIAGAQPCGSPTATAATLFPSGITAPAMRARSVTPVRCPRAGTGTPRRRNCVAGVRGGRVVSVGRASPACQGGGGCACSNSGRIVGPLPSATYAADVRRAAGCSARAMQVDRALTPPRLMGRVTSTDSLFSWGSDGVPPKPRPPLPPLALDSAHRQAMRRYGRRAASAGVSRAVAAVAAGDASPVEVHVSG